MFNKHYTRHLNTTAELRNHAPETPLVGSFQTKAFVSFNSRTAGCHIGRACLKLSLSQKASRKQKRFITWARVGEPHRPKTSQKNVSSDNWQNLSGGAGGAAFRRRRQLQGCRRQRCSAPSAVGDRTPPAGRCRRTGLPASVRHPANRRLDTDRSPPHQNGARTRPASRSPMQMGCHRHRDKQPATAPTSGPRQARPPQHRLHCPRRFSCQISYYPAFREHRQAQQVRAVPDLTFCDVFIEIW